MSTDTDNAESKRPVLNRGQRRKLKQYIVRKARQQIGIVKHRHNLDAHNQLCARCGLRFLDSNGDRCQCKISVHA